MFFLLLVTVPFSQGEIKRRQLAHHQLASQQWPGLILVHAVKLKPNIKAHISGKLATSGISDVAIASIYI